MRSIDVSNIMLAIAAIFILIRAYKNYRWEYSSYKIYKYLYILSRAGISIALLSLSGCIYILDPNMWGDLFFGYALLMVLCWIGIAQTFIIEYKLDYIVKGIPLGEKYRWFSTWRKIGILIWIIMVIVILFMTP